MKPGSGPTVEGLLVRRGRDRFVLIDVQLLEAADRTHALSGRVEVLRENVFCLQELQ
jgi:hypothetical protein